tara:strand:+ start:1008 stop:1841 length:834 start_codon:yes stop_codon:yes gene_type:complete
MKFKKISDDILLDVTDGESSSSSKLLNDAQHINMPLKNLLLEVKTSVHGLFTKMRHGPDRFKLKSGEEVPLNLGTTHVISTEVDLENMKDSLFALINSENDDYYEVLEVKRCEVNFIAMEPIKDEEIDPTLPARYPCYCFYFNDIFSIQASLPQKQWDAIHDFIKERPDCEMSLFMLLEVFMEEVDYKMKDAALPNQYLVDFPVSSGAIINASVRDKGISAKLEIENDDMSKTSSLLESTFNNKSSEPALYNKKSVDRLTFAVWVLIIAVFTLVIRS